MKLKVFWIGLEELQEYLDKYGEKIKHIVHYEQYNPNTVCRDKILLVIQEP